MADINTKPTVTSTHIHLTDKLMPEYAMLARVKRVYKGPNYLNKYLLSRSKRMPFSDTNPSLLCRCHHCGIFKMYNHSLKRWDEKCANCQVVDTSIPPYCSICNSDAVFNNRINRYECEWCNRQSASRRSNRVKQQTNFYRP